MNITEIDCRGLSCPLPMLRAKKALTKLSSGDVLRVLTTDPDSINFFNTFARQTGHILGPVEKHDQYEVFVFTHK